MAKVTQLLFLVDLYFGTGFEADGIYNEIKKYCDKTSNIIIENINGNGFATLKISKSRPIFGFLFNPCDVTWDTEIIDLSSKSKAEALEIVKSYVPIYGTASPWENKTYTCGCSV